MNSRADISPSEGRRAADDCASPPGRVEAARDALPPASTVEEVSETFGLLGDPARLRLLVALLDGEMCVHDLAATCGQSESGVSHALRLLRARRVVVARRSGRRAYYRLADAHVRMLLDLALTHHDHAVPLSAGPSLVESP